jgi:hypothetical protein
MMTLAVAMIGLWRGWTPALVFDLSAAATALFLE